MRPLLIKRIKEMVDPNGIYNYRFRNFIVGDNETPIQKWTDNDFDNLANDQLLLIFEQVLVLLYTQ
jgi:hypothetical protein